MSFCGACPGRNPDTAASRLSCLNCSSELGGDHFLRDLDGHLFRGRARVLDLDLIGALLRLLDTGNGFATRRGKAFSSGAASDWLSAAACSSAMKNLDSSPDFLTSAQERPRRREFRIIAKPTDLKMASANFWTPGSGRILRKASSRTIVSACPNASFIRAHPCPSVVQNRDFNHGWARITRMGRTEYSSGPIQVIAEEVSRRGAKAQRNEPYKDSCFSAPLREVLLLWIFPFSLGIGNGIRNSRLQCLGK